MKEFLAVAAIIAFFVVIDKVRTVLLRIKTFGSTGPMPGAAQEDDDADDPIEVVEAPKAGYSKHFSGSSASRAASQSTAGRRPGVQLPGGSTYGSATSATPAAREPAYGSSWREAPVAEAAPAPSRPAAADPWSIPVGDAAIEKAVRRRSRKERRKQAAQSTYRPADRSGQRASGREQGAGGGLAEGVGTFAAMAAGANDPGARPASASAASVERGRGGRRRAEVGSLAGGGRRKGQSRLLKQMDLKAMIVGHEIIEPRWKKPY